MANKDTLLLLLSLALLLSVTTGCVDVREPPFTKYIEKETPAGGPVPPPPEPTPAKPVAKHVSAQNSRAGTKVDQDTIQNFAELYIAKGSPKIAVFINRSLSDEVREWRGVERVVMSGEGERVSVSKTSDLPVPTLPMETRQAGAEAEGQQPVVVTVPPLGGVGSSAEVEGSEDKKRSMTAQSQQYLEEEKRSQPDGAWLWTFEEGMLEPFLQANANLIDRATAMRLVASTTTDGNEPRVTSPKQIEMDALKNYADLFIEMLVTPSGSSLYGYDLKASAKEVPTGRILANVTSVDLKGRSRRSAVFSPESTEYPLLGKLSPASAKKLGRDLAIAVMEHLIRTWGE
jgi:hypothetical protein